MALNQILAPSPQPKELLEIDINHSLTEEDKTGKNIATFSASWLPTPIFSGILTKLKWFTPTADCGRLFAMSLGTTDTPRLARHGNCQYAQSA